ncbi:hypothetical protein DEU56DRAFT_915961 [Suillus clintonianus]|uniref:uncharacterized protein n=1 Tax=Suillus clintonianus TaxID=1904413 RepID=UPI001B85CA63|nr:uncharacterized protein DEU56DRAFT_920440 [Suillus clintonianus]XP_041205151.1 uncharacterized protein DEU56DRAFT_915961 [Suillus clintonianus]KAG2108871.1 hypothetical protein DEU56DRAFT_920440 [Suillus clintonianus]KAG2126848.1 hypothetical protein DEU56DRAFT_915961 [Suillus clintonianus]
MAGTVWTTPEQKVFLETYYSGFLLAQLQAKVSQYWDPIYLEWFKRWPEEDVVFKILLPVIPVQTRKKVLGQHFRSGDSKYEPGLIIGPNEVAVPLNSGSYPCWIFSTIAYKEEVKERVQDTIKSGELVTKQEKLTAIRKLTREAYEAAPPEVQALCEEKPLQECTAPIAQFLQVIKDMTGWEWTVIGAGPDPHLGGKLNAMSYHTGVNGDGHNWKQATPKFIEKHLNPYLEFVGTLFPEHSITHNFTCKQSTTRDFISLSEGSGSLEGASSTVTPASHGTALHAPLTLSDTLRGVDSSQMQGPLPFSNPLGLTFDNEMSTNFGTDTSMSLNPYDASFTSTSASNYDFALPALLVIQRKYTGIHYGRHKRRPYL